MRGQQRSRRAALVAVGLGLVAATLAVYHPVADFGFVSYDDPEYVADNPLVKRGLSLAGLRRAFTEPHHGNWHPLTTLSYMLDCQLFGLDPGAQHRVNVGFHLLGTLLLFAWLLAATRALARSGLVAALFALHPLHVESVAWIAERKDVLSTCFAFAATLAYLGYVRAPGAGRYGRVVLLFALGLLAKPMLVTWPFVLLLLDYWPLRRFARENAGGVRSAVVEKLPLLVLSGIASGLTLWAQQAALASGRLHPLNERIPNALLAYVQYLGKAVWPSDLAVLYPYPESFPAWQVLASAALLIAVTAGCLALRRQRPYLLVGWLWYLGTLVPVIGIVQVGAQAYADRYTYIPLVGLFIAAVWGLADVVAARRGLARVAAAAAVGVLALLGVASSRQLPVWESSVSLYRHALRVTRNNAVIHNNLGIALGDLGRHDEAIAVYREGLAFPSDFVVTLHYNAGVAQCRAGRYREALDHLDRALAIDPGHAEALFHKGRSLAVLGRLAEARRALERVVELAPDEAEPQLELGLVLGKLGHPTEAKSRFERALVLQPLLVDARINLAIAYLRTGDPEAAIRELEQVLRLQPDHAAARGYLATARERSSP